MKTITLIASLIVTLALVNYSIGAISEQRSKSITRKVLLFLTIGVILDIIGTILMILGSSKSGITLHGVIGYSSLAMMLTDTLLLWLTVRKNKINSSTPRKLHIFTLVAYIWWVLAYITGGLLVAIR